jgi:hypothetical protein
VSIEQIAVLVVFGEKNVTSNRCRAFAVVEFEEIDATFSWLNMDELSRLPGKSLLFAIEVSGDEILHVFDVRFQNVAGDIETENVDDSFVRCDDFTNFFIDETILELFSSRGVPLKQKSLKKTHSSSEVLFQADPFF